MSQQLQTFINDVLGMPHYGNDNAGSGQKFNSHEDALADRLVANGYSEVVQTGYRINRNGKKVKSRKFPALTKKSLRQAIDSANRQAEIAKLVSFLGVPGLLPGQFIRQPCGSQSFPDFLICDTLGTFVIVEAKSGNGVVPAWNDSLVKKDCIYIFSSGRYNRTTVFLGQDVLDPAREKILNDTHEQVRQIMEQAKLALEATPDVFNRGFGYYARPKFEQGGGNDKSDFFKHTDRDKCETNVLAFALAQ